VSALRQAWGLQKVRVTRGAWNKGSSRLALWPTRAAAEKYMASLTPKQRGDVRLVRVAYRLPS